MAELGAAIVPVELPDVEATLTTFAGVFDVEMRAAHARLYPERAADYGAVARHALAHFATRDPLVHVAAAVEALAFRHRIDRLCDEIDVLLCPVAPITARPQVEDETIVAVFGDDHRNTLRLTRFTCFWDLAATPAVSLPWGFDGNGLPLAVQLVTRVGTDEALLSIAARLEAEAPDRGRRPPVETFGA
jgi:Asp-tRNA(Asn)/Glu-tRNA(Gln) amidotransferase A subunit family amidase